MIITCPNCSQKNRVADNARGKQVACGRCKTAIRVPGGSQADPWDDPGFASPPPQLRRRPPRKRKSNTPKIIGFIVAGVFGVGLITAAITTAVWWVNTSDDRAVAREQDESRVRLQMIAVALYGFHDTHAWMPVENNFANSAYLRRPLSWRVYVLLFLEQGELLRRFDKQATWDSPQNRSLIGEMPEVYSGTNKTNDGKSTLQAFEGNGAPFFRGAKPDEVYGPKLRDFTDGTSNTILVVEVAPDAAVEWTKPGGIPFDPQNPKKGLGTLPESGFLALMADGSVWNFPRDIPNEQLAALITHQGGEKTTPEDVKGARKLCKPIEYFRDIPIAGKPLP